VLPDGHAHVDARGVYSVVEGELANGKPLWKQSSGTWRMHVATSGSWMFASEESWTGSGFDAGELTSVEQHLHGPEVAKSWKSWQNGKWALDSDVVVKVLPAAFFESALRRAQLATLVVRILQCRV